MPREQKLMNYLHPILAAFQLPTAGTALKMEPLIPVHAEYQPHRERSQAKTQVPNGYILTLVTCPAVNTTFNFSRVVTSKERMWVCISSIIFSVQIRPVSWCFRRARQKRTIMEGKKIIDTGG